MVCVAAIGALAPTRPATATSPVTYVSASAVAGQFDDASPVAQCPVGSFVSGGGVKVGDGLSSISIRQLYNLTATSWEATVFNNSVPAHKVTTRAVCFATTGGTITVHQATNPTVATGTAATVGAGCGGENLLGGGVSSPGAGINVTFSRPSGTFDGWAARAFNGLSSTSLTVYALCSATLGPATFKQKSINVLTGKTGTVGAKCPNGTKVVSGGGAVETDNQLGGSFPMKHGSGWKASTRVVTGAARTLTAYAICLDPTP